MEARSIPLVLPRAHDCITLLMGSRSRFETYFQDHPGVYYRSTGWVERGADLEPLARNQTGMGFTLDALIERYGEDNGTFLYEELTRYQQTYQQLTFIETGIEPDDRFETEARAEAVEKGWKFEKVRRRPGAVPGTARRRLGRGGLPGRPSGAPDRRASRPGHRRRREDRSS